MHVSLVKPDEIHAKVGRGFFADGFFDKAAKHAALVTG